MKRNNSKRSQYGRFEITLGDRADRVSVLALHLHDDIFVGLNDLKRAILPIFFDERFDDFFDIGINANHRL
jgi:hypothetical protein